MIAQPVGTSFPQIIQMGPISSFSYFVSCLVSRQSCAIFVDEWHGSIKQWFDSLKMENKEIMRLQSQIQA